MAAQTRRANRPPRHPAYLHVGLGAVLMLVFASLLVTAPQNPPPAIAEIAPQAVAQIKEPPPEQESEFGSGESTGPGSSGAGDGDGGTGLENEPSKPDGSVDDDDDLPVQPRTKKCVGPAPYRQIEDPQSPPCVAGWEGDNGGATSLGVTDKEIRVGVPLGVQYGYSYIKQFEDFFNERFVFYGRQLKLVDVNLPAGFRTDQQVPEARGCRPDDQQSSARNAVEKQIFASTFYPLCGGFTYGAELAQSKVVYVAADPMYSESFMSDARNRPFVWQYPMATDRMFSALGDWACARFAHADAVFADGPQRGKPRKFGAYLQRQLTNPDISMKALRDRMAACNAPLEWEFIDNEIDEQDAVFGAIEMSQKEITSVFCLCDFAQFGTVGRGATSQGFYPEWLLGTYLGADQNYYLSTFGSPDQLRNTLGISFTPRQNRVESEPSMWAWKEQCPACGDNADQRNGAFEVYLKYNYRSLLLIASGIQMAGPNLTPETFERGLQRAAFPNPDHPIKAGRVGFLGASHSMTIDFTEWWYDPAAQSPYLGDPPGAMCYVDGGARLTSGRSLAKNGPFKQGRCDSGA